MPERPQLRRAITIANRLTLTRPERHELAELILDHTGSWSRMTEEQAERVADALNCYIAIQYLLAMRNQHARRTL